MKKSDEKKIEEIAAKINDGRLNLSIAEQFDSKDAKKIVVALEKIQHVSQTIRKQGEVQGIAENEKWAHLIIKDKIGEGGIGEVYRAYDSALNCDVAVKFLNQKSQLYVSTQQFLQEARNMAKVRHPHVLAIHGATIDKNIAGYWSDYLDGKLLSDKLLTNKISWQQQLRLARQMSEAVNQIHKSNLVHGDIKAQNIMLQEHRGAILLDFGSSRQHEAGSEHKQIIQASPLSMAPEQFDGTAQSKASDVFSLGLLFWSINTGNPPLNGKDIETIKTQASQLVLQKKSLTGSKLWVKLIVDMVAKKPKDRPNIQTVLEKLNEINQRPLKRAKNYTLATAFLFAFLVTVISLYSNYKTKQASNETLALNNILADTLMKLTPATDNNTMLSIDVLSEAQQMLIDNKLISEQQKIDSLFHLVKTYAYQDKDDQTIILSSFLLANEEISNVMKLQLLALKSHALNQKKDFQQSERLLILANKISPTTSQGVNTKLSVITKLIDGYNKRGYLKDVPKLLKQAKTLWKNSDNDLTILANIELMEGNYYEVKKEYFKAIDFYKKALATQRHASATKSVLEIIIKATLGANLMRYKESMMQGEQFLMDSITEMKLILGAVDNNTLSTRLFLAQLYANQENYQKSISTLLFYIPDFYKYYDQDFAKTFDFQIQLMKYFLKANQFEQAYEMFKEVSNSYYVEELKAQSVVFKQDFYSLNKAIKKRELSKSIKKINSLQQFIEDNLTFEPWKARRENLQYPQMYVQKSTANKRQLTYKITDKPFNWIILKDKSYKVATIVELSKKDTVMSTMQKDSIIGWNLNRLNTPVLSQAYDNFGAAITQGDFNNDGFLDLVIGVPNADFNNKKYTGIAVIIYASATGLNDKNSYILNHKEGDNYDAFASSLVSGDFNGDGFDDLAVGIPYRDVQGKKDAGSVAVYYGSLSGLLLKEDLISEQSPSKNAQFGWSIIAADFNQDSLDELIVSAPQKNITLNKTYYNAGTVHLYFGSSQGINPTKQIEINQNSKNMINTVENYDQFGWSLSAGDFNHDGHEDLAIGVPFESEGTDLFSGVVHIINGSKSGLTQENSIWSQYNRTVSGMGESGDKFGFAIATGDYNGDKIDDLIVGVPGEDYFSSGVPNGGVAHIIFGSNNGLTDANNQMLIQNASENNDMAEHQDQLGKVIRMADINSDGYDDVILGLPDEDIGNNVDSGLVQVIFGNAKGSIDNKSNYFCKQQNAQCGTTILTNKFGQDLSLIIAAPGRVINETQIQAGGVIQVKYTASENTVLDSIFSK